MSVNDVVAAQIPSLAGNSPLLGQLLLELDRRPASLGARGRNVGVETRRAISAKEIIERARRLTASGGASGLLGAREKPCGRLPLRQAGIVHLLGDVAEILLPLRVRLKSLWQSALESHPQGLENAGARSGTPALLSLPQDSLKLRRFNAHLERSLLTPDSHRRLLPARELLAGKAKERCHHLIDGEGVRVAADGSAELLELRPASTEGIPAAQDQLQIVANHGGKAPSIELQTLLVLIPAPESKGEVLRWRRVSGGEGEDPNEVINVPLRGARLHVLEQPRPGVKIPLLAFGARENGCEQLLAARKSGAPNLLPASGESGSNYVVLNAATGIPLAGNEGGRGSLPDREAGTREVDVLRVEPKEAPQNWIVFPSKSTYSSGVARRPLVVGLKDAAVL